MSGIGLSTIALRASKGGRRLGQWWAALRQESGANALEMAFVAMFMFILIAGIVDLGGAYQNYIIAINSSREGVRLYARLPCTSTNRTALKSAVVLAAQAEVGETKSITVTAANVTLSPNPASACPADGATVRVTVQVDYKTSMGQFWGATTFPIRAQTSMMAYGSD